MSKYYKSVSEWTMVNDYIQCMGCKGYDKSSLMMWKNWNGNVMPYCTEECYKGDE